jgi:DNA-directed RNA polymerase subunit N (RpoN/RPB10)
MAVEITTPCASCGNDDAEQYSYYHNNAPLGVEKTADFFASSEPRHMAIRVECDVCGEGFARTYTAQ